MLMGITQKTGLLVLGELKEACVYCLQTYCLRRGKWNPPRRKIGLQGDLCKLCREQTRFDHYFFLLKLFYVHFWGLHVIEPLKLYYSSFYFTVCVGVLHVCTCVYLGQSSSLAIVSQETSTLKQDLSLEPGAIIVSSSSLKEGSTFLFLILNTQRQCVREFAVKYSFSFIPSR